MPRTIAVLFAAMALVYGADKRGTSVDKLPKGAVEISPGVYRATDSSGKTRIYRQTPFGMTTSSEDAAPQPKDGANPFGEANPKASQASVADESDVTRVEEDGETLRFERKSPFGTYKWTRKKSDLKPEEKEAWERSRAAQSDKGSKQ